MAKTITTPPKEAEAGAIGGEDDQNERYLDTLAPKPPAHPPQGAQDKTEIVIEARHKTHFPNYRRTGLILGKAFQTFRVTQSQLEVLEIDTWVEVRKT